MMNRILSFSLLTSLLLAASCSKADWDDADSKYAADAPSGRYDESDGDSQTSYAPIDAIATARQTADGEVYFQIDNEERVWPQNFDIFVPGGITRPRRVVCSLVLLGRREADQEYNCLIEWLDFVEEGRVTDAAEGNDGVDVLSDWMTSLEDGFLTLHFETWWGNNQRRHEFALVTGVNPDDPYELHLVHNANRDPKSYLADALAAFRLEDRLPEPNDPAHTVITLVWTRDTGETVTKEFPYWKRN